MSTAGKRGMGEAGLLGREWDDESRWRGSERGYTGEDVVRLRGRVRIDQTLARLAAGKLWRLLHEEPYLAALGAMTGGQAVQMAKAGLRAIYPVRLAGRGRREPRRATYPDQSLYPANSAPALVRRLNNALLRADQIACAEGDTSVDWLLPIVTDAEAGFGGPLNAFG